MKETRKPEQESEKMETKRRKKCFSKNTQPASLNVKLSLRHKFSPLAKLVCALEAGLKEKSNERANKRERKKIDDGQRLLQNVVYCFKVV